MIEINEEKAALQNKAEELTNKIVEAIYDTKNVKGFYDSLDDSIKVLITRDNFQKLLSRLHAKDDKKNLSRVKDPASGITIRISQSQLFTYEILKRLGINTEDFFSLSTKEEIEDYKIKSDKNQTSNDNNDILSEFLTELNDKIDFVTDCVNVNKRGACATRFNDLHRYVILLSSQMKSIVSSLDDFECPPIFMLFILDEVRKLGFRSNKILEAAKKIAIEKIAFEKHTTLFVYAVLSLLVFIKKLLLFVSAYKAANRNLLKTALIVEEENTSYLNEQENKTREEFFIDSQIKRLNNEAFQLIDAIRLKQKQPAPGTVILFARYMNDYMRRAQELFFNSNMIVLEKLESDFANLYDFSVWKEKNPNQKYMRLFITKEFFGLTKDMRAIASGDDPDEEDDEDE